MVTWEPAIYLERHNLNAGYSDGKGVAVLQFDLRFKGQF